MTDWTRCKAGSGGTWGEFVAYAQGFGVTVQTLPEVPYADGTVGPVEFLHRLHNGEVLTYVMPKGCTTDRKLGFGRLANICTRLQIGWPEWPIAF